MSTCRFSNHGDFLAEEFDSISCSACFYFIYMLVKPYTERYYASLCPDASGILICPINRINDQSCSCSNQKYVYNIDKYALNTSLITSLKTLNLDPPLPFQFDLVTEDCCQAAHYCCRTKLQNSKPSIDSTCPPTWDGWNCFDWSSPSYVSGPCPSYIYGGHYRYDNNSRAAIQTCTSTGWEKYGEYGKEHTNYLGCNSNEDAEVRLIAGVITYSISVVVVIPAVAFLSFLRPIRTQPMFILHKHLLISFLAYGVFHLLNVSLFVSGDAPLSSYIYSNHLFCRFLFSIQLRFLRVSNFSWMLAEGVYLYRLLHTAQHSDAESLTIYKFVCWGVPATISLIYMFVRGINDEIGLCWIENSSLPWVEWMIILPSLIAMMVNVLLLTLVMYILVKKLRCDPHLERIQYRKAVRGALMLIPVFGIQQLLTIYRLGNTVYQAVDQSLNGLQGLFVALIVCYTNRTVIECALKFWNSQQEKRAIGVEFRQRQSIQESGKLLLSSAQKPDNSNNVL